VIQGFFQQGGVFERTPKYGLEGREHLPKISQIDGQRPARYLLLNLLGMFYISLPLCLAWQHRTWLAVPFLLLFPVGFALVILQECCEWWRERRLRACLKTAIEKRQG
jgi:hypothetical protein